MMRCRGVDETEHDANYFPVVLLGAPYCLRWQIARAAAWCAEHAWVEEHII
jgi:hypothetical protein